MSIIQGYRFFPHWGNEKYLLKEINAGMLCEYFPVLLESKELQDLSPDSNYTHEQIWQLNNEKKPASHFQKEYSKVHQRKGEQTQKWIHTHIPLSSQAKLHTN